MAFDNHLPVKRSSSTTDFDAQLAIKRNKLGLDHDKINQNVNYAQPTDGVPLDDGVVETLLTRSIILALDVIGFKTSEPLALESFRMGVEEYMYRFAADVRQCMLSSRRTQATPEDFLQTLHRHQLSLRALLPHLRPPVPPRRTRILLPYEATKEEGEYDHRFVGANPDDSAVERRISSMPLQLPTFPSQHTYKSTAEYPTREEDPRKIRERATEESRLGEQALRRLVSARSADKPSFVRPGQRIKSVRTQRDDLWKETMETANAQHSAEHSRNAYSMEMDFPQHDIGLTEAPIPDYGRVSSAVNANRKFWRKPAATQKSSERAKSITT